MSVYLFGVFCSGGGLVGCVFSSSGIFVLSKKLVCGVYAEEFITCMKAAEKDHWEVS